MKKLLIVLSLSFFVSNINAQVTQEPKMYNRTDDIEMGKYYKRKGNNQQIAGWAMLGGGITMLVAIGYVDWENEAGVYTLAFAGTISIIGSIPMIITGAKNKGRAEILLSSSNIPLSFDPVKNIPVKSVGIGILLGR